MKNRLRKNLAMTIIVTTSIMVATTSFSAGLKTLYNEKSEKWGFQDKAGKEVVTAKYDGVGKFTNGYIAVEKNNLWGFVDENGKEVVPTIYNGVSEFLNGHAPVIKGDKWGMINTAGKEVISFKYQQLSYFDRDGNAYAKKGGQWGKLDKLENIVVPFMYDDIDQNTKCIVSTSKVILDGVEVEFNAYNIDSNNYIKIRDIAKAIDGSGKQFEVSWNKGKGTIDLLSGKPYTAVGGELEKSDKKMSSSPKFTESTITKDGEKIVLKGYSIGNNNYFKIRDIVKEFNIALTWNQSTKTINIDTTKDYIKE